jgi:hypothetical protein
VAYGVRVRLGIDHAAVGDDEIERSGRRSLREEVNGGEQRGAGGEQEVLHAPIMRAAGGMSMRSRRR